MMGVHLKRNRSIRYWTRQHIINASYPYFNGLVEALIAHQQRRSDAPALIAYGYATLLASTSAGAVKYAKLDPQSETAIGSLLDAFFECVCLERLSDGLTDLDKLHVEQVWDLYRGLLSLNDAPRYEASIRERGAKIGLHLAATGAA